MLSDLDDTTNSWHQNLYWMFEWVNGW
jgi:hypothetical protein